MQPTRHRLAAKERSGRNDKMCSRCPFARLRHSAGQRTRARPWVLGVSLPWTSQSALQHRLNRGFWIRPRQVSRAVRVEKACPTRTMPRAFCHRSSTDESSCKAPRWKDPSSRRSVARSPKTRPANRRGCDRRSRLIPEAARPRRRVRLAAIQIATGTATTRGVARRGRAWGKP